jgi:hypothetical protein
MKKAKIITCIVALMLLMLPMQLQAQQTENLQMQAQSTTGSNRINFGNLSVIPMIELQGIYDDNIYRGNGKEFANPATTRQEKKEADWISHLKPGLLLNLVMPERGYFNLGYQGDFAFYNKNTNNNWASNMGLLDFNYMAPSGLIAGVADTYKASEDPYGNADAYAVGRVSKRWNNDLRTKLGYGITSNFRSILYYNNSIQKYQNILDFSQNYTDNEVGISVESRFMPRTWGFLRYHYGERKYDTLGPTERTNAFNSDHNWSRINTGLTWDAGSRLSGELNFGYQWLAYKNPRTSAGLRREDQTGFIALTAIQFLASPTTRLGMNIKRELRTSASDTNERFTDTGIGFNVQQQLMAKLFLLGGLSYSKYEYNTNRTDDNYLGDIALNYLIRDWLSVKAGYAYNRKDSNVALEEFVDNQFMVSLKIVY